MERTIHKKPVILANGQRVYRIIKRITFDGTRQAPRNIRAQALVKGRWIPVVPVSAMEHGLTYVGSEWKEVEGGT